MSVIAIQGYGVTVEKMFIRGNVNVNLFVPFMYASIFVKEYAWLLKRGNDANVSVSNRQK